MEEINALLDVWGAENVQIQLDEISRNRTVYQGVASSLSQLGYTRTWQQCKTKIKNLVQRYRKVKRSISNLCVCYNIPIWLG